RAIDEVLRFLQAKARDGADDLDHLDLLAAGLGEDDVERRLLLSRVAAATRGSTRSRDRDRSGSGDAPLLFDLVLQLDELEYGHLPELIEDGVNSHYAFSSSVSAAGSGASALVSSTLSVSASSFSSAADAVASA